MKRNFKSILKYFAFVLATALVTTVIFKLLKKVDQRDNNDFIWTDTAAANNKRLHSNIQTADVDWHDWEFINMEKLRTGKITFTLLLLNVFYFLHFCTL